MISKRIGMKLLTSLIVAGMAAALFFLLLEFKSISPAWALLLLIPIFTIPILRELDILRDVDERELLSSYRSSQIAFYSMILFVLVIVIDNWNRRTEPSSHELILFVFLAVVIKLASLFIMKFPPRKAGLIVASLCGFWWILFVVLSHGLSIETLVESAIGVSILVAAGFAAFFPRIGGGLLIALGAVLTYFPINVFMQSQSLITLVSMVLMLPLPPILAGALIIASAWLEKRGPT